MVCLMMFVVSGAMSIWDLDKVVAEELVHLILGFTGQEKSCGTPGTHY